MLKDKENALSGELSVLTVTAPDQDRRKALGIYYTPPEAARILARWAIRSPNETLLEPSFGGCAMLSAAIDVFRSSGNGSPARQLFGYDIDGTAFEHLAQMGIDNKKGQFKKQDFLHSDAGNLRVDAVLANPPFVSYHRLSDDQRKMVEALRQRYFPQLPRLASLWVYFLLHAMSFLKLGGRMAFVLPNAIGTADYARPLLTYLQERFAKVELFHVAERLFIQAGTDERISLLLLSGHAPSGLSNPAPILSRDILSIHEISLHEGSSENLTNPPSYLDFKGDAVEALTNVTSDSLVELGHKADVKIGEVVGDINYFVRPLSAWCRERIGPHYLVPILTRSAQIKGLLLSKRCRFDEWASIPYMLLVPGRRIPKPIVGYLSKYDEQDIANNRTFGKRDLWYQCSYEIGADAFIGSMSHDYPRIIGNSANISCSNAFYKINVKNSKLRTWLPLLSLSTPFRLSAEILGRVRGSGGIKLEPSDVRKLYLPKELPTLGRGEFAEVRDKVNKLVCLGEIDAAGQLIDSLVFLKPGLIGAKRMSDLRMRRLTLTNRRLVRV